MPRNAFRPLVEALEDRLALSASPLPANPAPVAGDRPGLLGLATPPGLPHKDNPAQVPVSQPVAVLFVAPGLIFTPSLIQAAGPTTFGPLAPMGYPVAPPPPGRPCHPPSRRASEPARGSCKSGRGGPRAVCGRDRPP
jgi:hypothetical protein